MTEATHSGALWPSLDRGGLLLTSRARLARRYQALHQRRERAAGKSSWAAPAIFALPEWLERCWARSGERLLLGAEQEALVWELAILEAGAENETQARAIAPRAAEAWRLAHAWRLEWRHPDWQERADCAAFAHWAEIVRKRAARNGWITAAELAGVVAAAVEAGAWRPPQEVWLAGFEPEEPQMGVLMAAFERAGSTIRRLEPERTPATVEVRRYADSAEEWAQAAAWARERMETGPDGVTGVIVPDLAQHRAQVEAIFAATLQPSRAPWADAPAAWHFSLGPPLAEQPLVTAALAWLEALYGPDPMMPLDQVGALLRSRFCAGAEQEAGARAAFEAQLRREQWIGRRLDRLEAGATCPQFAQALTQALAAAAAAPAHQGFGYWAVSFAGTLAAMGWPGERSLASTEFQAQRAWQALLDTLAGLEEVAPAPASAAEALARLRRLAEARIFQPQESEPAPVQVLGWLEAVGEEFDQVWVTGLHDGVLPAPAAPHPLLPLRLQRDCAMPHASAARESAFAQRLWDGLRRGSGGMIASYPEHEDDARLRPSPLLAAYAIREAPAAAPSAASPEAVALEWVQDASAPPVAPEARAGGSRIFREQSACPFRAFAHLRLRAAGLEPAQAGLAETVRGQLLHRVLAGAWQELQTQKTLLATSDAALGDLARRQATAAVDDCTQLADWPGLKALEQRRLERAVVDWLKYEQRLTRRPFAVRALEVKTEVQFGGLKLSLRRDREDELEGGGRVIVDYKSSDTSKGDWNPARFLEPQLPLYLVTDAHPQSVWAIAFAQLKPGKLSFKATAAVEGIVPRPKVPLDWEEISAAWWDKLQQLAADYVQGAAGVMPLEASCCRQCDLPLLCRIGDDGDAASGGDEEAGDDE